MTETIILAETADYYRVYRNSTSYATARDTANDVSATCSVGQNFSTPTFSVYRVAFKFDTSALAGQTVTDAKMRLVITTDQSATDFDIEIVSADWSASDPISAGNTDAVFDAIIAESTSIVLRNTSGIATNTQYTSPSMPVVWVNTSGSSYFGFRSSLDYAATQPSGAEYVALKKPDDATESYRPALIVTHTETASFSPSWARNSNVILQG